MAGTLAIKRAWGADSTTHQGPDTVVAVGTWTPDSSVSAGGEAFTAAIVNTALAAAGYSGDVDTLLDVQFGFSQDKAGYAVYDEGNDKVIYYGRADDAEDTGDLSAQISTCWIVASRS